MRDSTKLALAAVLAVLVVVLVTPQMIGPEAVIVMTLLVGVPWLLWQVFSYLYRRIVQ